MYNSLCALIAMINEIRRQLPRAVENGYMYPIAPNATVHGGVIYLNKDNMYDMYKLHLRNWIGKEVRYFPGWYVSSVSNGEGGYAITFIDASKVKLVAYWRDNFDRLCQEEGHIVSWGDYWKTHDASKIC